MEINSSIQLRNGCSSLTLFPFCFEYHEHHELNKDLKFRKRHSINLHIDHSQSHNLLSRNGDSTAPVTMLR